MIEVTLSQAEFAQATKIARGRGRKKGSKRFSKHSDIDTHLIGMVGEFAFGKATGLQVQTDVSLGGDNGVDFLVNDMGLQVKTRSTAGYPTPDLLCRPHHANSLYYILAYWDLITPVVVTLVGWCDRDLLISKTKNFGRGNRYMVLRNDLTDIDSMILWARAWAAYYA